MSESQAHLKRPSTGTVQISLNAMSVAALVAVLWGGGSFASHTSEALGTQSTAVTQTLESVNGVRNEVAQLSFRLDEIEGAVQVAAGLAAQIRLLELRIEGLEECVRLKRGCELPHAEGRR